MSLLLSSVLASSASRSSSNSIKANEPYLRTRCERLIHDTIRGMLVGQEIRRGGEVEVRDAKRGRAGRRRAGLVCELSCFTNLPT